MTCRPDLGNQRLLTPFFIFGMYVFPTVGTIFKDSVLREQCVVETSGAVYVTKAC